MTPLKWEPRSFDDGSAEWIVCQTPIGQYSIEDSSWMHDPQGPFSVSYYAWNQGDGIVIKTVNSEEEGKAAVIEHLQQRHAELTALLGVPKA